MNDTTQDAIATQGLTRWVVWLLAVAFVVYYFSFQTGYSIVNARVQADVGLSVSQVGMIAALYTWVFAICQFLSGPLLDRVGARKVLLPAIVLVTIGILLFARATSFGVLLLSQVFIALGACAGFVGAGYVGGSWFGFARYSLMFGFVQFAASLFSAFNQNLLSSALESWAWRDLFGYIGGSGLVLFALCFLWLRDPAPVEVAGKRGVGPFLTSVGQAMAQVARLPAVWVAAAFGALCFGVMLSLGVVWAPKVLQVRGFDTATANLAASLLWLGLAAGCFVTPWISDKIGRRKLPILIGIALQVITLGVILYGPAFSVAAGMTLYFLFGVGNSVHMLAFSSAADVVEAKYIGTSAAIVNGLMFIAGGIMISRPGFRAGLGLDEGIAAASLELVQFASRPLMLALLAAFLLAMFMRETHPSANRLKDR